jgi:predicted small metal-binding protein
VIRENNTLHFYNSTELTLQRGTSSSLFSNIVVCDHMCKGETEEELMEKAKQHAIEDNHFSEEEISRPETQNKIRSFIKRS